MPRPHTAGRPFLAARSPGSSHRLGQRGSASHSARLRRCTFISSFLHSIANRVASFLLFVPPNAAVDPSSPAKGVRAEALCDGLGAPHPCGLVLTDQAPCALAGACLQLSPGRGERGLRRYPERTLNRFFRDRRTNRRSGDFSPSAIRVALLIVSEAGAKLGLGAWKCDQLHAASSHAVEARWPNSRARGSGQHHA
jgi:hypothetical protein